MSGDPAPDLHAILRGDCLVVYAAALEVVPLLGGDTVRRPSWSAAEVDTVVAELARNMGQGRIQQTPIGTRGAKHEGACGGRYTVACALNRSPGGADFIGETQKAFHPLRVPR